MEKQRNVMSSEKKPKNLVQFSDFCSQCLLEKWNNTENHKS